MEGQQLDLSDNGIGAGGAGALRGALKTNSTLQKLDLSNRWGLSLLLRDLV